MKYQKITHLAENYRSIDRIVYFVKYDNKKRKRTAAGNARDEMIGARAIFGLQLLWPQTTVVENG